MTYNIHKSDGTLIQVFDDTISEEFYNPSGGSGGFGLGTQLVGKSKTNYGAALAQNFLQITENFASSGVPLDTKSLQGQLWFEKTSGITGNLYVRVSGAGSGGIANWKKVLVQGDSFSASSLSTPRTISSTGDATWTVTFDGSANVSNPITLSTTGVIPGSYSSASLTVDAKGRITNISSGASSAATLTTPRTISSTGDASWTVTFDGSANVSNPITLATMPGLVATTYANPSVTVDTKGRITAISSGSTSALGITVIPNFTLNQATPNDRVDVASTTANGWNVDVGRCTLDVQFISNSYFAANPNGHAAIGTRIDSSVIATQVHGQGVWFGNLVGYPPSGALYAPMMGIESWFNGIGNGNFLFKNSLSANNQLLQDGVQYRLILETTKSQSGQRYIRYRLYEYDLTALAPYWKLNTDTGDVLDMNTFVDLTKTGLVFAQVFGSNLVPWSIDFTNCTVTWGPAEEAYPDLTSKLTAVDAVKSFNTRYGDVTLNGSDVATALGGTLASNSITGTGGALSNTLSIARNANYTGGTPGWVNSSLYARTTVGAATTSFEWAITGVVDNYSTAGENVGVYGQGNKYTATGATWGMVAEATDHTNLPTSSGDAGLVGLEVDCSGNGDDAYERRIGIDVVVSKGNAGGAKCIAYDGIRVLAQGNNNAVGAFKYGINILSSDVSGIIFQSTGTYSILDTGSHTAGIDLTGATYSSGSAIRVDSNDYISLGGTPDQFRMKYNSSTGNVEFYNGATRHGYVNITSGADMCFNPATTIVSGTTQLAVANGRYALSNVATTTVTLPASPAADDMVTVIVINGLSTNVIDRNGHTIKGVAANLTLAADTTTKLQYINSSWWIV